MKHLFHYTLFLFSILAVAACSKDDAKPDPDPDPVGEASLTVSLQGNNHEVTMGDVLSFDVAAKKKDGSKDDYTVDVQEEEIFNVSKNNDKVTLTPRCFGSTTVTVTAKTSPALTRSFAVKAITPDYSVSPTLTAAVSPDTRLVIDISSPNPLSIGNTGEITIYKMNGTVADVIRMADVADNGAYTSSKTNFVGKANANNSNRVRAVNYTPVSLDNGKLTIMPHNGALEYNTSYYVTVSAGVINNFHGIVDSRLWSFRTRIAAPTSNEVTVAADGSADFCTIQGALDYAASKGKDQAVTINVKNGLYEELLYLRGKNNVTIKGESRDGVIIRYDNYQGRNGGSGGSAVKPAAGAALTSGGRSVFLVESCDMLRLENLTMENIHAKTGSDDQAEFIYFNSTGRLVAVNCNFIGRQDTLSVKGFCWFNNCMIAGDVDFIWGSPNICLFENCEIRTRVDVRNGAPVTQDCYVVQARVPNAADKGFVFLGCNFTKESGVTAQRSYFARSAGQATYDNVAIINCTIGAHVTTAGWYHNPLPNPATATATCGWKEYGSNVGTSGRLTPGSYQLTQPEYTNGYADRNKVFAGYEKGTDWMR